jgi:predicted secreted protein
LPKDKRSGKIAIVAHCILNQNSRVLGLAKRSSVITEVIEFLMSNGLGIVQMPCPELTYAGVLRKTQTKAEYDTAMFRSHCRKIAEEITKQIQEYSEGNIKTMVIVGVDGSPSCSVADSGILMSELHSALKEKGIAVPFCAVSYEHLSENLAELEKLIKG